MNNNKTRLFTPLIPLLFLITLISSNFSCSSNDGIGGNWNPDALGIRSSGIAFLSDREGDAEIYVMNGNGSHIVQLTDNDWVESHPTWSPDGTKIMFKYQDEPLRETEYSISIVDTHELNEIILPKYNVTINDPVWSPDSSRIIYKGRASSIGYSQEGIYIVNTDGAYPRIVAHNEEYQFSPVWSPDGTKISYVAGDIYVMDADGSNITQLTDIQGTEKYLTWSPDSSKILFLSDWSSHKICEIDIDGSNLTTLAEYTWVGNMRGLAWSPDLTKIAFQVVKSLSPIPEDYRREYYIYVMNTDGSNQIIMDIKTDGHISWSPDSNMITYSSEGDIWVVNADGTGNTNLTNSSSIDSYPVWSP